MNKRKWLPITAFTLVLVSGSTLLVSGCDDKKSSMTTMHPLLPKVQIIVAKAESIDVTTSLPARVNPYRIAEIRPQVNGTILKREFIEGSDIIEGQSLYQIDPGIYQAAYNSAKADADVKLLTLNRYQSLLNSKAISREDYDNAKAAYTQAKAILDNAEINLGYTRVYSPISGRIDKSNVTEGALVTNAQATPLATVQQLDPIYVDMTQATTDFLRLRKELANGTLRQKDGRALVRLTLENGEVYPLDGTLEFTGVSVSETTGSILLRAIFPNPDRILLPGMFVRTSLDEGVQHHIYLIPQRAVLRNVKGQTSVKIIDNNNTVQNRAVTVKETVGNNWIVTNGLKEGDHVVVSGFQKINDGAKVEIENLATISAQQ